ncbi:hypothetical protein CRUP_007774, partial [Coryphaenoides rupestris]
KVTAVRSDLPGLRIRGVQMVSLVPRERWATADRREMPAPLDPRDPPEPPDRTDLLVFLDLKEREVLRVLPVQMDLWVPRVLVEPVVSSVCPVSVEREASPDCLDPLVSLASRDLLVTLETAAPLDRATLDLTDPLAEMDLLESRESVVTLAQLGHPEHQAQPVHPVPWDPSASRATEESLVPKDPLDHPDRPAPEEWLDPWDPAETRVRRARPASGDRRVTVASLVCRVFLDLLAPLVTLAPLDLLDLAVLRDPMDLSDLLAKTETTGIPGHRTFWTTRTLWREPVRCELTLSYLRWNLRESHEAII